jgi:hypothetical protein
MFSIRPCHGPTNPRRQHPHEPRKAEDVGPNGRQRLGQRRLERRAVLAEGAVIHRHGGQAHLARAVQPARIGVVRHHDAGPRGMGAGHRTDQRDHVGPAARNQDRDAFGHASAPE